MKMKMKKSREMIPGNIPKGKGRLQSDMKRLQILRRRRSNFERESSFACLKKLKKGSRRGKKKRVILISSRVFQGG